MELFSQKFFSIYFNVAIVMIVISMVLKIWKNLSIDKAIQMSMQLPEDRKERMRRRYHRIISSQRIFLWLTPLGLLLVMAALVLLAVFPELNSGFDIDIRKLVLLMGILLVVTFIHFVEDSAYRKKILKAIDQS
jgi:membrane protease YdiL (CAAX protease family)